MNKRLLPLGLILLLAVLLAPLAQGYFRKAIITPLLYFYWVGRLIFESIPRSIFWGLFLIIALIIAINSLRQTAPRLRRSRQPKTSPPERIQTWAGLLQRAEQEDYYKWQLAQRLHKLAVNSLAHAERVDPGEIRQRLVEKQLNLTPEVQAYLEAGMTSFSHFLGARPRFRFKKQTTPLDLDPEEVIRFLEDNLDDHPE
ncbi:MAG: hypothetical protein JXM69_12660 [Anaerolineae bacterium]|nr:hypothetical protein [Anaerolineae bacterium]